MTVQNFEKQKAIGLIHKVYLTTLKKRKKHLASTKTKSEVRGGGKKPWRQKGTGNARAGSIRSPLWVGGGVSFGPRPYSVKKKINKNEKRLALSYAFSLKQPHCCFLAENQFQIPTSGKTKYILSLLSQLSISPKQKVLFLLPSTLQGSEFWLACRNLKNISLSSLETFDFVQLLNVEKIILPETARFFFQEKFPLKKQKE